MGTIQWLKQPANIDEAWKVYPIGEEPWVHRMRFVESDKRIFLIVAPLQGKGATAKANWMDRGPRLMIFEVPKHPASEPWKSTLITDELHVVHNFQPILGPHGQFAVTFASYEGLTTFEAPDSLPQLSRSKELLGMKGNQENQLGSRGCSEVKLGQLKGFVFYVTIEPWHGNQVVVYTDAKVHGVWERHVIDTELKWGHALWCCDLDGDGKDEIVVGVRDPFNEKVRSGVNVFRATDATGTKWEKHVIDNGGVATEDLTCGDLNGDGKIDIVAVGRATGNVKIYWNQGSGKH
jgi:aldos-2-ulose dehydratase/isomerase family protein/VCBS repeat protein